LLLAPIAVGLSAWQAKPPAPPQASVALPKPAEPVLVAQARPSQAPAQLASPYRKWVDEDVVYIIDKEEQAAFERLPTDAEREQFIEQFWLRRDPTPNTVENEFKEEHYRRIAYANEHFAADIPGWKTDRGRIYITYGPPDDISVGSNYPPPAGAYHYQQWRYRFIKGIGTNVVIQFVDATGSGEFRMTVDPSVKDPLLRVPNGGRAMTLGNSPLAFQVEADAAAPRGSPTRMVAISIPTIAPGHTLDIYGRITTMTRRRVSVFEDTFSAGQGEAYRKSIPLAPGRYRADVVLKDMTTGLEETGERDFEVK
jgi:GWxTD domain-containing protein